MTEVGERAAPSHAYNLLRLSCERWTVEAKRVLMRAKGDSIWASARSVRFIIRVFVS
jgi:hypothetical protein